MRQGANKKSERTFSGLSNRRKPESESLDGSFLNTNTIRILRTKVRLPIFVRLCKSWQWIYTLDINDINDVIQQCLPILYADDTHLCHAASSSNLNELEHDVNSDLKKIHEWMTTNGMLLNLKKCKYITICPQREKMIPTLKLFLDSHELECCTKIKSLGVIIDNKAKWTDHINDICRRANYHISTLQPII